MRRRSVQHPTLPCECVMCKFKYVNFNIAKPTQHTVVAAKKQWTRPNGLLLIHLHER